MPCSGKCQSRRHPVPGNSHCPPTCKELVRSRLTTNHRLVPPPQMGAAAVAQGNKLLLGCLDGANALFPSGTDAVVFAAALPHRHVAPMSSNTANPTMMRAKPSLLPAFQAALQGCPSLTAREIKPIHLLTSPPAARIDCWVFFPRDLDSQNIVFRENVTFYGKQLHIRYKTVSGKTADEIL